MSQWTHINGNIRLNIIPFNGETEETIKENIRSILGKTFDYYDEYPNDSNFEDFAPFGSEGSLNYDILTSGNESFLGRYSISITGDLRDYGSYDDIEKWLNKIADNFSIRDGVVTVEVEYDKTRIYMPNSEQGKTTFVCIAYAKA